MNDSKQKLDRKLTPFNVWAMAFGCVIGFGAFMMPGTVFLKRAGPLGTLIAMQLGAFVMLIISYSYGHMIKIFPVAGGEFVFAEMTFGKKHGFLCAWFLGMSYLCLVPVNANAIAVLFRVLFGNTFQGKFLYNIAGDDIYLGELLIALSAIVIFAIINTLNIKITGNIQTLLVILLLSGVLILTFAALFSPSTDAINLSPMLYPVRFENENKLYQHIFQILSISAIAPWAFVGFDTIPQLSEESKFNLSKVKTLMDICIICGCFVYISLTFIATSYVPELYANWVEYIDDIPNIHGLMSTPLIFAAYKIMGKSGLFVVGVSALCAMLTGILGFYTATSRLLYSLSREKMLPEWFGKLNKYHAPMNANLFCMIISIIIPLAGRNLLGWAVDMSSIGGAIGFGYTSLASRVYAIREHKNDIAIFGTLGFIFSVIFAVILLVPLPFIPDISLSFEALMCLLVWTFLGALFYQLSQ
ncbi:MAG: APC family permease [Synergistaceae bacterium]|nr:APC family permease [Synergistaceae bacterium]